MPYYPALKQLVLRRLLEAKQGTGYSPQRNKGGAKRGTFAEGSTRCPGHAP
jgi:hypothetical protein